MRRRTLTELSRNPKLIPGIYNFCDRWCERCPLSSRCLLYSSEQEEESSYSPENRDIQNEAFWRKLSFIFEETREMAAKWAEEAGVDLNEIYEDDPGLRMKRRQFENHFLARAGKKYANTTSDWFRGFDEAEEFCDLAATPTEIEEAERLVDAREIIHWYQYQIVVKTIRALSGVREERDFEDDELRDSDGSAKVALLGIDRSIAAWRLVQLSLPDRAETIVPLILQLEKLRTLTERQFPNARGFVRPGFDEILGEPN